MSELLIPIARFEHARDVRPEALRLRYAELMALLAPEAPPVRADLLRRLDRSRALLDRVAEGVLCGDLHTAGLAPRWAEQLDAVARRAHEAGGDEEAVRAEVRRRVDAIAEGLRQQTKLALPCWSPTLYAAGATRSAEGVEAVSCLVLDYDDGTTPEAASEPWMSWPHALASTWNHRAEAPRLRLILVMDGLVPAHAWPRVWRWAWERSGGHIDPACKDPSRLYFLPALQSARSAWVRRVHDPGGHLLRVDWASLPDPDPPPRPGPPAAPAARVRVPEAQALQLARQRLREDQATRERAARWLGARVGARRADQIVCPSCGRPSVWFWLAPGAQSTATCSHRNSCGWWGHLDELLDAAGGRDAA